MGDDIAAFIKKLGLKQVDIVGFSIGGFQAQEVTLRHPDLVRKLILLGTGPRGGDPWIDPRMAEIAPKPVHDGQRQIKLETAHCPLLIEAISTNTQTSVRC